MSNQGDALKALAGTLANDRGGESMSNDLFDLAVTWLKPAADGAAADAKNQNFWRNLTGSSFRVVACQYLPDAAVTANGSNYATLTLQNGASAAVTTATASVDTSAVSWVADTPVALTLSSAAANLVIAPNDLLGIDIAKTGTGVVVAAGTLVVQLRRI